MDGLGLIITHDHQQVINRFECPPQRFCGVSLPIPDAWEPPLPIWHQGTTSSCTGHAINTCFQHEQCLITGETTNTSPWFCYQLSRHRGGFTGADRGAPISSTLDAATNDGTCLLSLCPSLILSNGQISRAAFDDAAQHRHYGELRYDLRGWEAMISWITDRRPLIIGTTWFSGQRGLEFLEDLQDVTAGSFQGYHARAISGYRKINGEILPRVINSHGIDYGSRGVTYLTRRAWEKFCTDPNFTALGFGPIHERIPERRDWSKTTAWALGNQPTIG